MPAIGKIGNVGHRDSSTTSGDDQSAMARTSATSATPGASGTSLTTRRAPRQIASGERRKGQGKGKIEVSPRAIATVAGRAVASSYGVVGIAARHPRFTTVELLSPEHYSRGVDVHFGHDHVIIELYVVLEHGLRITTIAANIMSSVKFAVERTLGLRVVQVNVNVQALRVSRPDDRQAGQPDQSSSAP